MNQIKLSVRCGDDPRIIREENGVPTFVTVFAIHNPSRKNQRAETTLPINVKAFDALAVELSEKLTKGAAFVVEGELTYFRHPETRRESYSIRADQLSEIRAARVQG